MRVAILGNYPPHVFSKELECSSTPRNGVSTWLVNSVKHLAAQRNTEVHVLAETNEIRSNRTIYSENVTYHFFRPHYKFRRSSLYAVDRINIHKKIKEIRPDILHAHHTGEYAWYAINEPISTVITLHGVYGAVSEIFKSNIFSHYGFLSFIERISLKKAKHIISINQYVNEYISNSFFGKTYEIENPVHEIYFTCKDQTEPNALIFIAVLSPIKGLHCLMDVLKIIKHKNPQICLRIIGFFTPGLQWYQKQIEKIIFERNLTNNVIFLGPKSETQIADQLQKANCLLLTSKQETAPMVISEAMAAGKPVVAMDVGGVHFMIRDGVTGFVTPKGDSKAMADRVLQILEDDILRERMGVSARSVALEKYHPEAVAKKTIGVYEEILKMENWR